MLLVIQTDVKQSKSGRNRNLNRKHITTRHLYVLEVCSVCDGPAPERGPSCTKSDAESPGRCVHKTGTDAWVTG